MNNQSVIVICKCKSYSCLCPLFWSFVSTEFTNYDSLHECYMMATLMYRKARSKWLNKKKSIVISALSSTLSWRVVTFTCRLDSIHKNHHTESDRDRRTNETHRAIHRYISRPLSTTTTDRTVSLGEERNWRGNLIKFPTKLCWHREKCDCRRNRIPSSRS